MADERTDAEKKAAERKAEADALSAELDAEKKRLEIATAQRDAAKDLVPELAEVEKGTLTVPEASTVFQSLLGSRALADAAAKVAPVVKAKLPDAARILVLTDLDLASRDAGYETVIGQLNNLHSTITAYPDAPQPSAVDARLAVDGVSGALAAGAKLLPGLLSLISARRTITNTSGTIDDDVAAVAVAGALAADAQFAVVDKARLLKAGGPAQTAWQNLREACDALSEKLDAVVESPTTKDWLATGKELLKSGETALAAMVASSGKEPSALAKASLQEALHGQEFKAVLIIKGGISSSSQLVDDRALHLQDKISLVSTATISYLLVDHLQDGKVLAGGLAIGEAELHGSLGARLLPREPAAAAVDDPNNPLEHGMGGDHRG